MPLREHVRSNDDVPVAIAQWDPTNRYPHRAILSKRFRRACAGETPCGSRNSTPPRLIKRGRYGTSRIRRLSGTRTLPFVIRACSKPDKARGDEVPGRKARPFPQMGRFSPLAEIVWVSVNLGRSQPSLALFERHGPLHSLARFTVYLGVGVDEDVESVPRLRWHKHDVPAVRQLEHLRRERTEVVLAQLGMLVGLGNIDRDPSDAVDPETRPAMVMRE